ncbi:MAG: hypothetical protein JWO27_1942 [Frankiales bacterium]|nr:hypothetical protein [Frankiales bacterium]
MHRWRTCWPLSPVDRGRESAADGELARVRTRVVVVPLLLAAVLPFATAGGATAPAPSFATYDRGRHWKTYDATPGSPVQVGSVCTGGTACSDDRNLLDFNDMVLDGKGRVVIGFADGCLKTKGCTTADRLRKGAIVRQTTGPGLYR